MKKTGSLKLVGEVRDLQIVDSEGRNCGVCDDIAFAGRPGEALSVEALLVGPGAYRNRLPRWMFFLVRMIAGEKTVRVPWSAVDKVTARIYLTERGETVGLRRTEDRLERLFRKVPTS